jgi:hypothetical protein
MSPFPLTSDFYYKSVMSVSLQSEQPKIIRHLENVGRTIYFMRLRDLNDWPNRLFLASQKLRCTSNLRWADDSERHRVSLCGPNSKQGLAYFCAWGPDCERIHDLFDQKLIEAESDPANNGSLVITTWHDQTIEEAVWYSLYLSVGAGKYGPSCRSWIIVPVERTDWAEEALELAKRL